MTRNQLGKIPDGSVKGATLDSKEYASFSIIVLIKKLWYALSNTAPTGDKMRRIKKYIRGEEYVTINENNDSTHMALHCLFRYEPTAD